MLSSSFTVNTQNTWTKCVFNAKIVAAIGYSRRCNRLSMQVDQLTNQLRMHANGNDLATKRPRSVTTKQEKPEINKNGETENLERILARLSQFATAPKTYRMPEPIVYLLEYRARQLGISSGRLLQDLLWDILPVFGKEETKAELRMAQVFHLHEHNGLLRSVDSDALFQEIRDISNFRD